jgi:putative ABC transport system permease protein
MLSLIGDSIPRAANAGVNPHVLAFSTVVSLAVGLVFGIIPAITTSRESLVASQKDGDRSGTPSHDGVRSFLIVGQVALGMVVITAAGLLGTSFMNLMRANQGSSPDHILTFFFDLPDSRYKDIRQNFYRQYFDRLRTVPGVQSLAGVMILPTMTARPPVFKILNTPSLKRNSPMLM